MMKTCKLNAIALAALFAGVSATAYAGPIQLTGDTRDGFGGQLIEGQYIGEGGQVRLTPGGNIADDEVVEGGLTLDFDFRYEAFHVGLADSANSNNGQFTLTNGDKDFTFGSHDLDSSGRITTNAFDGSLAGGDWIIRLDNPDGGDPWAAFSLASNFEAAPGGGNNDGDGNDNGGNGGGGNGGNGGNGGGGGAGGGAGGGSVPAPAPLALIGAMGLFGAWRRKRAMKG